MTEPLRTVDPGDPSSLLDRMRAELTAICADAPQVWQTCAAVALPAGPAPSAVVLTGCGDSLYACFAVRELVEELTGIPTVAWPAMEVATAPSRLLSSDALLVGVSVSGKVGRTIEAVEAHARRGGATVAVTSAATSRLAAVADTAIVHGVLGTPGPVPATSTYVASLLGLMSVAAGLAGEPDRAATGARVLGALALLPALRAKAEDFAREVAPHLREPFFAAATGVDAGTVHYATAKLLEAAGLVGVPQDLEEWAHEQYFATDPSRTLLLCVTDERALVRGHEVAAMAAGVGGRVAWVGLAGPASPTSATLRLPATDAAMSPLVAWLPFALTALEFARQFSRYPFGTDRADRMTIADSAIYVPTATS